MKGKSFMINNFSCKNFRNVNVDSIKFNKINVFIGPNNVGKTNFIKALTFLPSILNCNDRTLHSAFLSTVADNGWERIRNFDAEPTDKIDLKWDLTIDDRPVIYTLAFKVGHNVEDCNIVLEELNAPSTEPPYTKAYNYFRCHDAKIGEGHISTAIDKGRPNQRKSFKLNSKDTIINQFKDILLYNKSIYQSNFARTNVTDILNSLDKYFSRIRIYSSSQFNTKAMQLPVSTVNLDTDLLYDASNFVNIMNYYKSEDIRYIKTYTNKLQQLVHDLQDIDVANMHDKLYLKLYIGGKQFSFADMSEGTIKAMVLNLILNLPFVDGTKPLLAIDEPEANLHPAWQKVVGQWMLTSDTFQQLFVSTHSPDFLDTFTESFKMGNVSVFVFDAVLGIKEIKYEQIAEDLNNWELGDLYRVNDPALGGWPW